MSVSVHAAQIEQTVPVGIVARQTRDFESENDSDVPECHLCGHAREAAPMCDAGARKAQIVVDHTDLLFVPAEGKRTLRKRVLALCRFAVVLNLIGAGLADVDESCALQMACCDLTGCILIVVLQSVWKAYDHDLWSRSITASRVAPADCRRAAGPRRPGSVASLLSCSDWRSKASMMTRARSRSASELLRPELFEF